jgi:hypothetical protein
LREKRGRERREGDEEDGERGRKIRGGVEKSGS